MRDDLPLPPEKIKPRHRCTSEEATYGAERWRWVPEKGTSLLRYQWEFREWFEDNLDRFGFERVILSQEPCPDYVVKATSGRDACPTIFQGSHPNRPYFPTVYMRLAGQGHAEPSSSQFIAMPVKLPDRHHHQVSFVRIEFPLFASEPPGDEVRYLVLPPGGKFSAMKGVQPCIGSASKKARALSTGRDACPTDQAPHPVGRPCPPLPHATAKPGCMYQAHPRALVVLVPAQVYRGRGRPPTDISRPLKPAERSLG